MLNSRRFGGNKAGKVLTFHRFRSSVGVLDGEDRCEGSLSRVAECKLLLHLGNQLAFFVDREKWPSIRFCYGILL